MQVKLTLLSDTVSDDALDELTRDLCATLNEETEVSAEMAEGALEPGAKGDAVSLGALLLTFLSSGTAVALFEVAKAFFERNSSLELELERPDGARMVVRAENVDAERIDSTLNEAREFFGEVA